MEGKNQSSEYLGFWVQRIKSKWSQRSQSASKHRAGDEKQILLAMTFSR
jgi:hypothetical protein